MQVQRRIAAAAVALGVALSAMVLGSATPAQAIPMPTPVAATSALNAVSPKPAFVACPAGEVVYGAGGTITGGAGNVVMSDVIPTPGGVTVWGIEVAAFAGAWSVTAYAICGPPTGNVIVTNGTPVNAASPKFATASCPAGLSLYGTGYSLNGANGQVFPSVVEPDAALTNVTAGAYAHAGFAGNWGLVTYGICAVPAPFMQLMTSSSPANPVTPKATPTGPCAGAGNVHGVGASIAGAGLGDIVLETMAPAGAALAAGNAAAAENAPVATPWSVTSYAICSF